MFSRNYEICIYAYAFTLGVSYSITLLKNFDKESKGNLEINLTLKDVEMYVGNEAKAKTFSSDM